MKLRRIKPDTNLGQGLVVRGFLEEQMGVARYLGVQGEQRHVLIHVISARYQGAYELLQYTTDILNTVSNAGAFAGMMGEWIFFVEDFPLGEYLFEWMERRERVGLLDALRRIIDMLKGLSKAHAKGVYHGRITPKSVLLERSQMTFSLRLMGLGVAQALEPSMRLHLDWFDYSFDLEGLSPVEVDIYGVAIVLMGMVAGEPGIDRFEETGLLPEELRGGLLQVAIEKALAMKYESYASAFAFMQDLEAALLELDKHHGEVYIGDLVGFESVLREVASKETARPRGSDYSGLWNSLINDFDKEERNSILHSLTSLTAVKALEQKAEEDDDDDETKITAMPSGILAARRIYSARTEERVDEGQTMKGFDPSNFAFNESAKPLSQKVASLKALEMDSDMAEESPTRIMQRPNYKSVSVTSSDAEGMVSAIQNALKDASGEPAFMKRIRLANIVLHERTMHAGYYYPDLDDDISEEELTNEHHVKRPQSDRTRPVSNPPLRPQNHQVYRGGGRRRLKKYIPVILIVLLSTIIVLLLIKIIQG